MRTTRKRRAVIFDDEPTILDFFHDILTARGYEVIAQTEPVVCTVYMRNDVTCNFTHPCADLMITDDIMPRMHGLEMLRRQAESGCKLDMRNKALSTGDMDERKLQEIERLGCSYLPKPFMLSELEEWIADCETRMDLTKPLATRRSVERFPAAYDITFRSDHADTLHSGTAVNISHSGLCVRVPVVLAQDQRLQIHTELPISSQRASVRWVSPLGDGAYLAGLSCC